MTFNFLDCFDENIDNLDITKNYIYVLNEEAKTLKDKLKNILNNFK
jgi:hypothetical protein